MYCSTLSLTLVLEGGGWLTARRGRLTTSKETRYTVEEAGWAPGSVWTGAENLTPTGVRSPDRLARSESM